jgi:hypothetical protein
MSAGYMGRSKRCIVVRIDFVAKSKTRTREFGFFGRKIEYVVTNRAGFRWPAHSKPAGQIGLTRFFQARIMLILVNHGSG